MSRRDDREPPDVTYTVAEVAARLKLSTRQVYRMVDTNELPCIRFGRTIRIPVRVLDDLIASAS